MEPSEKSYLCVDRKGKLNYHGFPIIALRKMYNPYRENVPYVRLITFIYEQK